MTEASTTLIEPLEAGLPILEISDAEQATVRLGSKVLELTESCWGPLMTLIESRPEPIAMGSIAQTDSGEPSRNKAYRKRVHRGLMWLHDNLETDNGSIITLLGTRGNRTYKLRDDVQVVEFDPSATPENEGLGEVIPPIDPELEERIAAEYRQRAIERQAEDLAFRRNLRQDLPPIMHHALPPSAINRILKHFQGWQYSVVLDDGRRVSMIEQTRGELPRQLNLDATRSPRRRVTMGEFGLAIIVDEVLGEDIESLLDLTDRIEGVSTRTPKKSPELFTLEPLTLESRSFAEEAKAFKEADNTRAEGEDYSPREKIIMSILPHVSNQTELATALDFGPRSVSRMVNGLQDRLEAETFTDLTLISLGRDMSNIDHIPWGQTVRLNDEDRALLQAWYSLDKAVRATARENPKPTEKRFSKMLPKVGCKNRHVLTLCAVRDEVISLPKAPKK